MATFEIIMLTALYLFSFSYMTHSLGIFDEHNTWTDTILIILAAGTIGVVYFPLIFAEDIWNKLNKEKQQ